MFCMYCGKALPDDVRFCGYCGKAVVSLPQEEKKEWQVIFARAAYDQSELSENLTEDAVIAELGLKSGDEVFYLSIAELEGIPNVYRSPVSTIEGQLAFDREDTDFWDKLEDEYYLDYANYREILQEEDTLMRQALRYVIALIHLDPQEEEKLIENSMGKNILDLWIPQTEIDEENI